MQSPYALLTRQMLSDFEARRFDVSERIALSILRINPKDSVALQILGLSFAMQGKILDSIPPLQKASIVEPKNSEILVNLAKAQFSAELFSDALKTYEKLARLIPNNAYILTDLATCLAKLKMDDLALLNFNKAIGIDPSFHMAWSNLGNLYSEMGHSNKAIEYYERSLSLNADSPESWTNYGNALFALRLFEQSKAAHERSLSLDPNYAEALSNYGNTLLELRMQSEAYSSYQRAFNLKPQHPYLIGELIASKRALCIWDDEGPSVEMLHSLVHENKPASIPFVMLQSGADMALQKRCAINYALDRFPSKGNARDIFSSKSSNEKIRVGYFSSDFKNHPVGILIKNIIEAHDRSKFEVYGFFLNEQCSDEMEQSLVNAFDHSFNLFSLSDAEAIDLVLQQKIDIAIDLNGHTSGARTAIFASKVAPVQVNYLGYAGTMGAEYYDYIVADKIVIPHEHQEFFTEEIAYLPHSFFPVDTSIGYEELGNLPDRASENLPPSGFVFSCFNNSYKISPEIFSTWMSLLKKVPDSILWLSRPSDIAATNLRSAAKSSGVDPNRIIFANRVPSRKMHLSRLRLSDLFLDTPNYNAHATAADALWAGVPVLTLLGNTFAGRVAASQNHALGMDRLVAKSIDEYIKIALQFSQAPEELASLRSNIESNRKSSMLFDIKSYVVSLESLYYKFLNPNR